MYTRSTGSYVLTRASSVRRFRDEDVEDWSQKPGLWTQKIKKKPPRKSKLHAWLCAKFGLNLLCNWITIRFIMQYFSLKHFKHMIPIHNQ